MKRHTGMHQWNEIVILINFLVVFSTLIVTFGMFEQQPYMKGFVFWIIWIIKNCAVIGSLGIPILLGMHSQSLKGKNKIVVIILSLVWIIMMIANLFSAPIFTTQGSLYLIKNIGSGLVSYLALMLFGPIISQYFRSLALVKLRKITGGMVIIYFVSYLIFGTKWMGVFNGPTIILLMGLFLIGIWISVDPVIQRLRYSILAPGTGILLLISIVVSWMNTNVVAYDPHHGLTTTVHYLDGISFNQPLLVAASIMIMVLVQRLSKKSRDLSPASTGLLGINFLLMMYPRVFATGLSFLIKPAVNWNPIVTFGVLLILTVIFNSIMFALIQLLLKFVKVEKVVKTQWLVLFKKATIGLWRTWLFIVIAWIMTVVSMWQLWGWKLNMIQWVVLHRELIIFINVLMIYLVFAILMSIFNRYWWASIATLTSYAIWLLVNVVKIASRNEPVLPVDTSMVTSLSSINDLLKLVSTMAIGGAVAIMIIMIVIAGLVQHFDDVIRWGRTKRIIMLLISVVLLGSFSVANHPNTIVAKGLSAAKDKPYFYSQLRAAKLNGTVLQFANNIDVTVMKQPVGYSKKAMLDLQNKYQGQAQQINKTRQHDDMKNQTVVFALSESFADPADVPNLKVNGDPIPYIHELEKSTTSGKMISSGYGGGTANMEYQALTSLSMTNFSPTLPTPYSQLVPYQDQTFAISDMFDYRVAIHPFTANLYNRKQVYSKLGFDKFYHLQDGDKLSYTAKIQNSPYISDASAYSQTLKEITDHSGSQFINLVTMQNHMPFDNYYEKTDYSVSGTAYLDAEHKKNIENYIQGIHYTDDALKEFNQQLDEVKKPVTVVWYGDHLPGIYNGDSMHQYGLQLHATDYLIYGNQASSAHNVKLAKHQVVSPNDFAAMLLKQMSVKVSPYYALLTKVYEDLPAMSLNPFDGASNNTANGSSIMVDDNQHLVSKLTKKQTQLLHDYQLVQYDLTTGKGYLAQRGFMSH